MGPKSRSDQKSECIFGISGQKTPTLIFDTWFDMFLFKFSKGGGTFQPLFRRKKMFPPEKKLDDLGP